jgi:hypothetical protein
LAYAQLGLNGDANKEEAKRLLEEVVSTDPTYHQALAGLFLLDPNRRELLDSGLGSCIERIAKAPEDLSYPFHRAEMELLKGDLSEQKIRDLFFQAAQKAGIARGFAEESILFLKLAAVYLRDRIDGAARDMIRMLQASEVR